MANRDPVNDDTWLDFVCHRSGGGEPGCCGLCGDSGLVDTRGNVKTPRGYDCGVRAFCICRNGRILKHTLGGGELPPPPERDLA